MSSSPAPPNSEANVICSFSIPSSRISGVIANDHLLHLVKDAEKQYNVAYEYSAFSSSSVYTTITFAGSFASVCKARSFVLGHLIDKVRTSTDIQFQSLYPKCVGLLGVAFFIFWDYP